MVSNNNKDKILNFSNKTITWAIIIFLLISIIYLVIMSIIVKDLKYPREHPFLFTLETFRDRRMHDICAIIQAAYRSFRYFLTLFVRV